MKKKQVEKKTKRLGSETSEAVSFDSQIAERRIFYKAKTKPF